MDRLKYFNVRLLFQELYMYIEIYGKVLAYLNQLNCTIDSTRNFPLLGIGFFFDVEEELI